MFQSQQPIPPGNYVMFQSPKIQYFQPIQQIQNIQQIQPIQPIQSVQSIQPMQPMQPIQPMQPMQPIQLQHNTLCWNLHKLCDTVKFTNFVDFTSLISKNFVDKLWILLTSTFFVKFKFSRIRTTARTTIKPSLRPRQRSLVVKILEIKFPKKKWRK